MNLLEELGDGKVIKIESGETIFRLDSYEKNPIVKPQDLGLTWYEKGEFKLGAVFNGGACIFQDKVILMPRCHQGYKRVMYFNDGIERYYLENYISEVWPLVSEDGIHFTRFHNVVIRGDGTDHRDFIYGIEDIRIIKCGQRYLLVGCGKLIPPFTGGGGGGDRIAVYSTEDFANITYHGMVESFDSRNAVPFSESVNGQYYMLLRFHPNIHLDFLEAGLEQLLNPSKHIAEWKKIYERRKESLLLEAGHYPHEKEKIGPSTQLIRTDRGWLFIYHAVGEIGDDICKTYGLAERIERGYSVCAALLDLDDPREVLCRTRNPIYIPSAPYELHGNNQYPVDVPAVVFPVGAVVRKSKLIVYAGAADKYVILLSCKLDNLVNYLWEYCKHIA